MNDTRLNHNFAAQCTLTTHRVADYDEALLQARSELINKALLLQERAEALLEMSRLLLSTDPLSAAVRAGANEYEDYQDHHRCPQMVRLIRDWPHVATAGEGYW